MKKTFVYSLLAILALTGCQTKELDSLNDEPEVILNEDSKVFTAIIDDDFNPETRTTLDGEGNVLWKMGDQVSIFAGSTVNEQYQVTDASDGKTAASLNKVGGGGFVAGTEIDNNVAFYPYASTAEIAKSGSNYVISEIELPATQTYAAGSFGNGAFPMATVTSSTEDMNLKFKNVLGGLKLQLKGTATITSITVTGNNNEILCGDAEVTTTYGGVPSIVLIDASAKTVTLNCGAGVTLDSETATPFIIALPPMTMTGGFTVEVTDSEGKKMQIKTTKPQTITRSNLLKMPAVNYVGESIDPYLSQPLTITSTGSTSVSIIKQGAPDDIILEYKKNGEEWVSYTIGLGISLADGEYIQFRAGEGGNTTLSSSGANRHIVSVEGTGTVEASGNIMSLLDRSLQRSDLAEFGFNRFFYNCTQLISASNLKLPVLSLPRNCYAQMFEGCTALTSAPALPATSLARACYSYMFEGCTALTSAPALPATSLERSCYAHMFEGCTALTSAPELPATSLAENCYEYMFQDCTALISAPTCIPATTLQENCCYSMFSGCTALTSAPVLPATKLAPACYNGMFINCTNLMSAPALPATIMADYCYAVMFGGCTALTSAPELPAIALADHCYASMFSGCKALTSAPELPATTLASNCYYNMFAGCTSLTTAPELPATKLVSGCYNNMFDSCKKLNYIKALFTTTPSIGYTMSWVSGISATGTFVKSSSATWDVTGVNGVPSGWTIETE